MELQQAGFTVGKSAGNAPIRLGAKCFIQFDVDAAQGDKAHRLLQVGDVVIIIERDELKFYRVNKDKLLVTMRIVD